MIPSDPPDAEEPTAAVPTGRRGQSLICEGWFASHGDGGTPGPHVHLRTSDREDPVLRTDQVPDLVRALTLVADRIERIWEVEGDEYAENVVLRSSDPQDPNVARRQLLARLTFVQRVADNLPAVVRMLTQASSTDEALIEIAALLGVDEAEVLQRLARFDLLSLTRAASQRRVQLLADDQA